MTHTHTLTHSEVTHTLTHSHTHSPTVKSHTHTHSLTHSGVTLTHTQNTQTQTHTHTHTQTHTHTHTHTHSSQLFTSESPHHYFTLLSCVWSTSPEIMEILLKEITNCAQTVSLEIIGSLFP